MSGATSKGFFLGLPDKNAGLRRGHTASPPARHLCAPQTSHGFIPLGSARPTPTPAANRPQTPSIDYSSLPKKKSIISPDAVVYEPHGFIPLCSVAPVAKDDEAGDYFSHAPIEHDDYDQLSPDIVDEAIICSAESSTRTPDSDSRSSTLTPRFHRFIDTSLIPMEQLTHPTGSPIHGRDIIPSPDRMSKPLPQTPPHLRGGGVYDPSEEATDLERRRCISVDALMAESLQRLEKHDETLSKALSALETAVSQRDQDMIYESKALERTPSPISLRSDSSGIVYSCEETERGFSMVGNHSEDEITDDEGPTKGDVARTTTGSNSDDDDSEYFTAPCHPQSEPEDSHSPTSYQATALRNSLLLDMQTSQAPSPISPRATNTSIATLISPYPPSRSPPLYPPSPLPYPPNRTLHHLAADTCPRVLSSLLHGPKFTLINSTTTATYTSVPRAVLLHFCGQEAISRLLPTPSSAVIPIPNSDADCAGVTRVVRFMRRCCLPTSHTTNSGEMRIPQGDLGGGIETIRACRVFGLYADATRIENLMARIWLAECVSIDEIELIWNEYHGSMRESMLGDAVVWFILKEVRRNENGLAEVLLWMMEQDEFDSLKERVRREIGLRLWKGETRDEFLARGVGERKRKEKKRRRLERLERDRVHRIEEMRRTNRVENKRRLEKEEAKSIRSANMDVDPRKSPTALDQAAGSESEVSSLNGFEGDIKSASEMYADYARSCIPSLTAAAPTKRYSKA